MEQMNSEAIREMNLALKPLDDNLTSGFSGPTMPVTFFFEAGRSGSTLLLQLLINGLNIGYVSNLLAKFWLAPYLGALLEKDSMNGAKSSGLESRFGMTDGPHEPNEWGWFWQSWLGLEDGAYHCPDGFRLDGAGICAKLAALEQVKSAPLVFDNVYASANFPLVRGAIAGAMALRIRRDPYYVCNSHINARIDRYGDINRYYGIQPRNYDAVRALEDPVEQVCFQVQSVLRQTEEALSGVPAEDVLNVDYERVVADPGGFVDRFRSFLEGKGCAVGPGRGLVPEGFDNRNDPALVRPEFRDRLNHVFPKYFDGAIPS